MGVGPPIRLFLLTICLVVSSSLGAFINTIDTSSTRIIPNIASLKSASQGSSQKDVLFLISMLMPGEAAGLSQFRGKRNNEKQSGDAVETVTAYAVPNESEEKPVAVADASKASGGDPVKAIASIPKAEKEEDQEESREGLPSEKPVNAKAMAIDVFGRDTNAVGIAAGKGDSEVFANSKYGSGRSNAVSYTPGVLDLFSLFNRNHGKPSLKTNSIRISKNALKHIVEEAVEQALNDYAGSNVQEIEIMNEASNKRRVKRSPDDEDAPPPSEGEAPPPPPEEADKPPTMDAGDKPAAAVGAPSPSKALALSKSKTGKSQSNAISRSGDAEAVALNGTSAAATALTSSKTGSATSVSNTAGDGGAKSLSLAKGAGNATGTSFSKGKGDAQSAAVAMSGGHSRADSEAKGGGNATSSSLSNLEGNTTSNAKSSKSSSSAQAVAKGTGAAKANSVAGGKDSKAKALATSHGGDVLANSRSNKQGESHSIAGTSGKGHAISNSVSGKGASRADSFSEHGDSIANAFTGSQEIPGSSEEIVIEEPEDSESHRAKRSVPLQVQAISLI